MDQDTQPKLNSEHIDIIISIWSFLAKNALGIASVIFGITAKVYIIRRQAKRVTRNQCLISVFMAGMAGVIAWYVVSDLPLKDFWKAIISGYLPIIVEPITLRVIIWIDPIIDEIGKTLKAWIHKQNKN